MSLSFRGQRRSNRGKSPTGPTGSCGPNISFRLGPSVRAFCAILQTLVCMASVFLWPTLSWSAICSGIPHLAESASRYLIILISDWAKFPINLHASSGGAWRALAALISCRLLSFFAQAGKFLHAGIRWSLCVCRWKRQRAACGSAGLGERCRKCALREGLPHGHGQGGKGERHNQASGDPRHHDPRAVRIDPGRSTHSGTRPFWACNLAERGEFFEWGK